MKWIVVSIATESGKIDETLDRLTDLGIDGMQIEDEQDFRQFLENNHAYWDYVDEDLEKQYQGVSRIKFYLPNDDKGRASLKAVQEAGFPTELCSMDDADWENDWKKYYEPIPIGDRLLIVPEWLNPDLEGRTALRLDPGLTFGTGSHATTRMCLESLQKADSQGKRVLDLGCGSGILGIGAMVLGAAEVQGCDIDPKSPGVALENAALNGITEEHFQIRAGNILSDRGLQKALGTGYDIVFANIVADVIIPLAPLVRPFMAPGAIFITSGIIEGREAEVEEALKKAGFRIRTHLHEEEWNAYICE